jgi:hypothetical protein
MQKAACGLSAATQQSKSGDAKEQSSVRMTEDEARHLLKIMSMESGEPEKLAAFHFPSLLMKQN